MPNARSGDRNRPHRRSGTPAGSQVQESAGRFVLVLGVVALVAALGYVVLRERNENASTEQLASSVKMPASSGKRPAGARDSSQTRSVLGRGWAARGARPSTRQDMRIARHLPARQDAPADSPREAIERLLRVRSEDGSLTRERADEIRHTMDQLSRQGREGAAAIEDLRRRLENGDLDALGGSDGGGNDSPTFAGGDPETAGEPPPEEVRTLLERLAGTMDPMEIAMLAKELEETAPGVYRQEVLNAARQALRRAAQDAPEQRVDVTPVFEVFEAYGGDGAVKDLEQQTTWWPYSLMALAGMPDGKGVPSLMATASNPGIPVDQRPQLAFQMLAQAAADYPQAGQALVDLARDGQIPERAWGSVGAALQGMHLRFPLQIFDDASAGEDTISGAAPRIGGFESDNLDVHYDLRLVSPTWSQEQIDRQIDLIDELIDASASSDAKRVLNDARTSLLKEQ